MVISLNIYIHVKTYINYSLATIIIIIIIIMVLYKYITNANDH